VTVAAAARFAPEVRGIELPVAALPL